MDAKYWRDRWLEGRIGFHRDVVHPHLAAQLAALTAGRRREVLVPLCGKSLDLLYLRDQGHAVTGVEVVREACDAFIAENELTATESIEGRFRVLRAPGITILNGDFFHLETDDFDFAYDRGAMIAMPPELHPRYAEHLIDRLLPGARLLLLTVEYDRSEMEGPPFSITDEEVHDLFRGSKVEMLIEEAVDRETVEERSLSWMRQRAYGITA